MLLSRVKPVVILGQRGGLYYGRRALLFGGVYDIAFVLPQSEYFKSVSGATKDSLGIGTVLIGYRRGLSMRVFAV